MISPESIIQSMSRRFTHSLWLEFPFLGEAAIFLCPMICPHRAYQRIILMPAQFSKLIIPRVSTARSPSTLPSGGCEYEANYLSGCLLCSPPPSHLQPADSVVLSPFNEPTPRHTQPFFKKKKKIQGCIKKRVNKTGKK